MPYECPGPWTGGWPEHDTWVTHVDPVAVRPALLDLGRHIAPNRQLGRELGWAANLVDLSCDVVQHKPRVNRPCVTVELGLVLVGIGSAAGEPSEAFTLWPLHCDQPIGAELEDLPDIARPNRPCRKVELLLSITGRRGQPRCECHACADINHRSHELYYMSGGT